MSFALNWLNILCIQCHSLRLIICSVSSEFFCSICPFVRRSTHYGEGKRYRDVGSPGQRRWRQTGSAREGGREVSIKNTGPGENYGWPSAPGSQGDATSEPSLESSRGAHLQHGRWQRPPQLVPLPTSSRSIIEDAQTSLPSCSLLFLNLHLIIKSWFCHIIFFPINSAAVMIQVIIFYLKESNSSYSMLLLLILYQNSDFFDYSVLAFSIPSQLSLGKVHLYWKRSHGPSWSWSLLSPAWFLSFSPELLSRYTALFSVPHHIYYAIFVPRHMSI